MADKSDPTPSSPEESPLDAATRTVAPSAPEPAPEDWATRYKYLLADFENYRRRTERDRENLSRQVRGAMVRELLPILEAFRTGRDAAGQLPPDHPLRRGMELLDREWATFLKHEGVEPIARIGAPFRPEEADAVGESPPTDRAADGTVVEIVQQGYRFFGGIVRPAKVIVARAPSSKAASAESSSVAEE